MPYSDPEKQKEYFREYNKRRRGSQRIYEREYYQKHKKEQQKKKRIYYQKNKEHIREHNKDYRLANKGKLSVYSHTDYERHKGARLANGKRHRQKLRREIIEHYGNVCACCGENKLEFLCIDHIEGNGNKHRREVRGTGTRFYYWIRENNFPNILRVLCHNCNMSLGFYGYCPHKK